MFGRLVLALLAAVGLVLVAPAVVNARPAPAGTTVTVSDQSGGVLPARTAARAWVKSGAVNVRFGACAGPGCIVVRSTVTHTEGTCFATTAGCAFKIPDGTCIVEVASWVTNPEPAYAPYQSRFLPLAVTTHEVGHCLGVPHIGEADSIMNPQMSPSDPTKTPSSADLQYLRGVIAGTLPTFDVGTLTS